MIERLAEAEVPTHSFMQPVAKKTCRLATRVRSLCYNDKTENLIVLSHNGYIHSWNACKFRQILSKQLPHKDENVCLSADEEGQLYAIGSKGHTDLIDSRTFQTVTKIMSGFNDCGIRSVSFKGQILTIGTGIGYMTFFDLRTNQYLESNTDNLLANLKATPGWVRTDEPYVHAIARNLRLPMSNGPAIYTHCYDSLGTRLFAAGGPYQSGLKGNYLALFQ